jgi:hypothetical protein
MGAESGIGNALYVAGRDLSGETQSWNLFGTKNMQDVTTIRQAAFDRNGLLPDSGMKYDTILDMTAGHAHAYLSTMPTTDELITLCHRETLGAAAASMYSKQITYDTKREGSGALMLSVESQSSAGTAWDWGRLLTAGMRIDTVATNGASVDFLAAHAFGIQAYLHVFAFTGTTCTIAIQSSSDNGAGDAFTTFTGSTFTAVTAAPNTQRITTARNGAVERYLRVVTTGTFTSITFAVEVVVNDTTVVI